MSMPYSKQTRRSPRGRGSLHVFSRTSLALAMAVSVGCTSTQDKSVERNPARDFGAGATLIMPGQSVPMPDPNRPWEGSNVTAIGGTRSASERRDVQENRPTFLQNLVKAPAALIAAPAAAVANAVKGPNQQVSSSSGSGGSSSSSSGSAPPQVESENAPPQNTLKETYGPTAQSQGQPQTQNTEPPNTLKGKFQRPAPSSGDPHQAIETARLSNMERELASRNTGPSSSLPPIPLPIPQGPQARDEAPAPRAPVSLSIADELAILQASVQPKARPEDIARAGASKGAPARSGGVADQVADRDGDGRPDHWVYRHQGKKVRELFDENGDTAPDRTIYYDARGEQRSVEEDRNQDGRLDSWVEFKDGAMARQRRDTDHDGFLDTWTFYRNGEIAREEQDLNGDGFRNRMAFFEGGRITREREDRNGDGRIDRVTLYDEQEKVRQRDEDQDGNGLIDTRSYYENGRLSRRELIEETLTDTVEPETLTEPEWDTGTSEAS